VESRKQKLEEMKASVISESQFPPHLFKSFITSSKFSKSNGEFESKKSSPQTQMNITLTSERNDHTISNKARINQHQHQHSYQSN
jgi:hypothetical protein